MQYVIILIVAIILLALGVRKYRRPGRRKFEYHERFRSIQVLEPAADPVKSSFGLHLWK
jgi:hypothetical protein